MFTQESSKNNKNGDDMIIPIFYIHDIRAKHLAEMISLCCPKGL